MRILVVEDDLEAQRYLVNGLKEAGHVVDDAADGDVGLTLALSRPYDMAIIDRMLPKMDGIQLVEEIRQQGNVTPVLFLSALSEVDDRVKGLKAGGDDYLTKPFALDELLARVEALLRRPPDTRETKLRLGDLTMDLIDRTVARDGRPIELLPREFKLLEYLMRRPGQVVTRAMLFEDVWNYRFAPHTNLVDVHIGKLRRKIDTPGEPSMIQSVVGSGFCLRAPD